MNATLRLFVTAALLCSAPASAKPKPVPGAKLFFASGTVTVESKGSAHAGEIGEPLGEGDAVTTGDKGTAVVELADGSRLKLRESGRVVLSLPGPRSPVTTILLSIGGVFAKVAKQLPGAEFHVRTPSAVAAVRGTQFFTAYGREHGKARDLWVCVNEGAVEVKTTASDKAVRVPAGKGVLIKNGLDTAKPQAFDWTKTLNWNMDPASGDVEDKTNLDAAYADLLDQDYR
ncbi:MAG: FecR domain-containing protein [Elusimicrobiota bacterium]